MKRKTGKPPRRGRWRGAMTEHRLMPVPLKGPWQGPGAALAQLREQDAERGRAPEFDPIVVLGLGRFIVAEFVRSFRMRDTALSYERDLRSFLCWYSASTSGRPLQQPLTDRTRELLVTAVIDHLDQGAAARMSQWECQALRLRVQGLNGKQIAAAMGLTPKQARDALYWARRKFSEETVVLKGDQVRALGGGDGS